MKYIGLQAQQSNNNLKSLSLLVLFPLLILALVYTFLLVIYQGFFVLANQYFLQALPYVVGVVLVWFLIAYFGNTLIINISTGSEPLERKDNKRVYNLIENLCIANGMPMPKVNIIHDNSLNAFASGINQKTYTVTLTKGIINKLADEELEGVIAHELSHIRNHDVRLLIISIVFVGIFSFIASTLLHSIKYAKVSSNKNDKGGAVFIILLIVILAGVGYLFSTILKLAISRKREYLADASAAEMTKKPEALASALRKISKDSTIESVTRDDVAQLFIEHPKEKKKKSTGFSSIFATHPPIEKRIQILEQF